MPLQPLCLIIPFLHLHQEGCFLSGCFKLQGPQPMLSSLPCLLMYLVMLLSSRSVVTRASQLCECSYVSEVDAEVVDAATTRFDCGCLAQLVAALAVLHLCEVRRCLEN